MNKTNPKLTFVLGLVLLMVTSGKLQAQNTGIKINILAPIVKTFNVSLEQKTSASSSAQIGFFYTGYSTAGTTFSGFGLTPEYRFYLSETEAINGFYAAPFVRYTNFTLKDDSSADEASYSAFGGGVVIGKQWVFKERVILDLFLGPKYVKGTVSGNTSGTDYDVDIFDGFGLRTGINFGIAF